MRAAGSPDDDDGDFTAAERARERAFHAAVRPPARLASAASMLGALGLGLTPAGAALVRSVARRAPGPPWLRSAAGTGVALAVPVLLRLPADVVAERVRRRAGLSTSTWGRWTRDALAALAIGGTVGDAVLVGLPALARSRPRSWPGLVAAGGAAVVVVGGYVAPVLVEPVFNRFTPLGGGPLRDDLLALADRDGVAVRDVLVADASRRTTALNAYVSGLGRTRRVVVYDTLLERPEAEVRGVVAHELGHVVARDVATGTAAAAAAVAATGLALPVALRWRALRRAAAVSGAADPAVGPLLVALARLAGLALGPLALARSRAVEGRADRHALDLTEDPATFARMHRALALTNLADLDPSRLRVLLTASHPTTRARIAAARRWAREHDVPEPGPLA